MSTIVVTPPAAAALVAVVNPSLVRIFNVSYDRLHDIFKNREMLPVGSSRFIDMHLFTYKSANL